jgi:hypothetical protein
VSNTKSEPGGPGSGGRRELDHRGERVPARDLAAVRPREGCVHDRAVDRCDLGTAIELGAGNIPGDGAERVLMLEERVACGSRIRVSSAVWVTGERRRLLLACGSGRAIVDREVVAGLRGAAAIRPAAGERDDDEEKRSGLDAPQTAARGGWFQGRLARCRSPPGCAGRSNASADAWGESARLRRHSRYFARPPHSAQGLTGLAPVAVKTAFVSRYISIVSSDPSRPKPDCL